VEQGAGMESDGVTLGEIARSCARIEATVREISARQSSHGERMATLEARILSIEGRAPQPSSMRPTVIAASSGPGLVAIIEAVRHFWK
jgi:hypothetical protein